MSLINHLACSLAAAQGSEDWDSLDSSAKDGFISAIHAVVRAMRDPNERMIEAGVEVIRNVTHEESEFACMNDAATTWRFMIDVLLDEDK